MQDLIHLPNEFAPNKSKLVRYGSACHSKKVLYFRPTIDSVHDRLLPAFVSYDICLSVYVYVCECALNNKIELRRQLQQQHGNGYFYGKCFDNVFVQNKSLVFVLIHKTSDKKVGNT